MEPEKVADAAAPIVDADQSILDAAKAPDASGKSGEPKVVPEVKADGDQKPPADGEPKEKPADKPTDEKPVGAPEKYEPFKAPEGVVLDAKGLDTFTTVAKELNLNQDQAQKLVDFQTGFAQSIQEQSAANFKQQQKEWADQTKKDLGADADKQLAYAAQARDKFAPEKSDLREILNKTGLANHPAVIKHFISIGKTIGEDGFTPGKPAADKDASAGSVMYPNQGKS
jgi:hypothetical protein